jgi:hypothetical protein
MASHNDVSNHHDLSAVVGHSDPSRAHPHDSVPVRVAREGGFAGPGLDVPAETHRAARAPGTPRDHALNKPLRTENEALAGPPLGVHPPAPLQPTCVYHDPEFTGRPGETFEKNADIAAADANFVDRSDLLMRPRKGTTTSD